MMLRLRSEGTSAMQFPRFLRIVSHASALTTIRRTSSFFIWTSIVVIFFGSFEIFDAWLRHQAKAPSASSIELVSHLLGYMLVGIARNNALYILFIVNGLVLRRYKSRVSAALFLVVGVYAAGLGIFMVYTMLKADASQTIVIVAIAMALFAPMCTLVAARALAAAIKLHSDPEAGELAPTLG